MKKELAGLAIVVAVLLVIFSMYARVSGMLYHAAESGSLPRARFWLLLGSDPNMPPLTGQTHPLLCLPDAAISRWESCY